MEIALNHNSKTLLLEEDEVTARSGRSYEILERIGSGGNGAVYECINTSGNEYAVKFLLHSSRKNIRRFEQEIALLKRLKHPHIIGYIDDGIVEMTDKYGNPFSIHFVVMEKADSNLVNYIKAHSTVGYETYAAQFRGLCEALSEIHQYAIHRDIKPENILIKGETWVISDFGLCEFIDPDEHQDITRTNEKIGPAFWMSPEAVNDYYFGTEEIGAYSDVFQLCAVFAFVLMRRHPGGNMLTGEGLNTTPPIKKLILASLSNHINDRPKNGKALVDLFNSAIVDAQTLC